MPTGFDQTHVDKFFAGVDSTKAKQASVSEFLTGESIALQELRHAKSDLGDEEYLKFAQAVASDTRISKILPELLVDALEITVSEAFRTGNTFPGKIDKNGNHRITKDEFLSASNDTSNFDPIFRKVMNFGADNFDKLITLYGKDGFPYGNSWSLTTRDRDAARGEVRTYEGLKNTLREQRMVFENFDQIDSNKSGKITFSEVVGWGRVPFLSKGVLPELDPSKMIATSSEVTKPQYEEMIKASEAELSRRREFWGLR